MLVLSLMRNIVLYTPGTLNSVWKDSMFLLPTILILWHTWIYVCSTNSGNIASNIKAPVNESFSFVTTLNVSDIQLDNNYIRLQKYFNNMRSWGYCNVNKYVVSLNDGFYHICCNRGISILYWILIILKYDLDWSRQRTSTLSILMWFKQHTVQLGLV